MATLTQRIDSFFDAQDKTGSEGLQIIHASILQVADVNHDSDAILRILGRAERNSDVDRVVRMALACYFGTRVKLETAKDHYSGYRLTYTAGKWPHGMAITAGNNYAAMTKLLADKAGIYQRGTLKALSDALRGVEEDDKVFDKQAMADAAKRFVAANLKKGANLALIQATISAAIKAEQTTQSAADSMLAVGITSSGAAVKVEAPVVEDKVVNLN
jgi:hypothetical protein